MIFILISFNIWFVPRIIRTPLTGLAVLERPHQLPNVPILWSNLLDAHWLVVVEEIHALAPLFFPRLRDEFCYHIVRF